MKIEINKSLSTSQQPARRNRSSRSLSVIGLALAALIALVVPAAQGQAPGYTVIDGACRGDGWNQNGWPKHQGGQTEDACRSLCDETNGCTAFDIARPNGGKYDCYLFGHSKVKADGNTGTNLQYGRCYTKSPLYAVIEGPCRGDGWNQNGWPKHQGGQTWGQCQNLCETTAGCTSFDIARPNGGKYDCYLFGHNKVIANGITGTRQTGRCYTKSIAYTAKDGACRGAGWNQNGWPKSQGAQTWSRCLGLCEEESGCTAFDVARPSGDKYACYLFGHSNVTTDGNPGTNLQYGRCYMK